MDRFTEMQTLVAVVDQGSFVKAADALGLSKAAVSRHLGQLESRLGIRLLHRTTRRLSLTEEGEVFYARCKTLLADVDAAEAEVTERGGEAIGQVRVNAPLTFGILHLAELWGAFKAMHPRVSLEVTLADRYIDLVEEGYDLAVRIGRLESSSLIARKLATTRLVLCASPQYLAHAGIPKHPGDLVDHAVLAYSYLERGDEWPFEGPDGPVTVTVQPTIRTNNGDTCRVGALMHQGIVLQPTFLIGPDLEAGRLVEVLPEYRSLEM
ncbi:MAG: LysR family transcriptional regulator, partial [Gammaproteobacteria bacterium]|nr:LysR family transcriptional regulator [Gammaproteobacteria bacterium]